MRRDAAARYPHCGEGVAGLSQLGPVRARDPRLDFFRGSAMFIIFIAHCRGNVLWNVIPARFGMSDAADMFVFLSGMAASIAFGGTFIRLGAVIGTARIAWRCVQLYAAHLGLFFASAAIIAAGTRLAGGIDYVVLDTLQHFFADPGSALIGLFTLTYVPHYFDILPLYIVVLAMVPAAMLLARIHPACVVAASVALWAAANRWGLNFPANADQQPVWYFNPFAWQLIFFTGFALRRGWVRVPLDSAVLLWGSIGVLVLGLGISLPSVFERVPPLDALRIWIANHTDKTDLDLLQYLHFLAEAYVAVAILKGREGVLLHPPWKPFVACGQQALSIFVSCEILAQLGGMVFDRWGNGWAAQIVVNGVAFAVLFAVAYLVAWLKRAPWKRLAAHAPAPVAVPAPLPLSLEGEPALVPWSAD
jgi:hypothetical protein